MKSKYPIHHYLNTPPIHHHGKNGQMHTSVSADFSMSFLCFEQRFQAELKKVKTPRSKLFNFEHRAELKNPLPISTIWGRGIIYEHQQSPYPFELKTGILSSESNQETEVRHE